MISSLSRMANKRLPLKILNFPHNLPVHLSEMDLMIESDGVTRISPKLADPVLKTTPTTVTEMVSSSTDTFNVREPSRLTAFQPITPDLVTATASTTNYGDDDRTGAERTLNNNNNPPTGTRLMVGRLLPTNDRDRAAAINRNGPQHQQQQKSEFSEVVGNSAGETPKRRYENEAQSANQMTKSINDLKNNKSAITTMTTTTTRVDNDDDEGRNGEHSSTTTGSATPFPVTATLHDDEGINADIYNSESSGTDEVFIRKSIPIDDDSKHYIITSSGDIQNIPLANQHLVSQFRENFINEIMPLNSVEKAVRVDMPPPTLILDTYPSQLATRMAFGGSVESTASILSRDDNFPSTIAFGGGANGVVVGGAPTSSNYRSKIFIPSGMTPSGPAITKQQQQQQPQQLKSSVQKNGQESADHAWQSSDGNKESAAPGPDNKIQDPVCIVMGKCLFEFLIN